MLRTGVVAGFVTLFESLKNSSSRNPDNEAT